MFCFVVDVDLTLGEVPTVCSNAACLRLMETPVSLFSDSLEAWAFFGLYGGVRENRKLSLTCRTAKIPAHIGSLPLLAFGMRDIADLEAAAQTTGAFVFTSEISLGLSF